MSSFEHLPVLLKPIQDFMRWESHTVSLLDCTVGGAGHLSALLKSNPRPQRIVAVDQDQMALRAARETLKDFEPIEWVHSNFRHVREKLVGEFDRILIDLGVSSPQLDSAERGFSFRKQGPLDMRMNPDEGEPAWQWLARCDREEFVRVLRDFGEEKRANHYARLWFDRKIDEVRDIEGFVQVLGHRLDSKGPKGHHPLTRVFQAIRMRVNDEYGALEKILGDLPSLLKKGGRVAILSFHSLEDRAVKWRLREALHPITKKVVTASFEESRANPRSRSAKLRVYEKE